MDRSLTVRELRKEITHNISILYPDVRKKRRNFYKTIPPGWDDNVPFFDPNNSKDPDTGHRYQEDKLLEMNNYLEMRVSQMTADHNTNNQPLAPEQLLNAGADLNVDTHQPLNNNSLQAEDALVGIADESEKVLFPGFVSFFVDRVDPQVQDDQPMEVDESSFDLIPSHRFPADDESMHSSPVQAKDSTPSYASEGYDKCCTGTDVFMGCRGYVTFCELTDRKNPLERQSPQHRTVKTDLLSPEDIDDSYLTTAIEEDMMESYIEGSVNMVDPERLFDMEDDFEY